MPEAVAKAVFERTEQWTAPRAEGRAGTSAGINIARGSQDDGWAVPRPACLGDGTQVQLYKDGEALHAAFDAIKAARRRICLEVYIFRSDPTGMAFADLLCAKARGGVDVYLIYDSVGCMDSNPAMFDRMRAAGVRLAEFHPIRPWECRYSWRPALRDHRKLLLIDDEIAGLGGLNIGGEYAGSWVVSAPLRDMPWRDNAIGIVGPSARRLLIPFTRSWRYVHLGGKIRGTELMHDDGGEMGILASSPGRQTPLPALRKIVQSARRSILLTMSYFCPPDGLVADLCRAAKRGVRVRLMLPGICDVKLLLVAARSFYDMLLGAGVEIYERQGAVLHAKTLCIDGHTSIIGSTNLDYRSVEYNCELSVILRNAHLGQVMHDLFECDVRYARRITAGQWRHRPVLDRLMQWAVYRTRYIL